MTVVLGTESMTTDQLLSVTRDFERLELGEDVLSRLTTQREAIDAMVESGTPIYGLSTGFGSLATTFISPDQRRDLQRSLIRSHAAGVGPEVEREVVRAMMVSRLTNLCSGVSGVRPSTALAYAALLNAGITPIVHEFGSLGCSGDLAPLAHVALALMGEGEVRNLGGQRMSAREALADAGLEPVELAEKEGLALINGTDGMLGQLIMAIARRPGAAACSPTSRRRCRSRRCTARTASFIPEIHALRPHPGQRESAANLAALLADSPIVNSHLDDSSQVQDAYSLRCAPQVHGAARDTFRHAERVADDRARLRRSTIPRSSPTAPSSPTETSTVRRWATRSTSSRSCSPTSRRCPSGAPTGCSTRTAATVSLRSWHTRPASIRDS